jgi:rhodanese-related sulfurtransferase
VLKRGKRVNNCLNFFYIQVMKNSTTLSKHVFTAVIAFLLACGAYAQSNSSNAAKPELYQCLPCGYDCDDAVHTKPGTCEHCNMELVKKSSIVHKTIQPSALCAYIKAHPDVILLDVRSKGEFEGRDQYGTLKNAINIPVRELQAKIATISNLKNKEIIVYCSHSHRSPEAAYILTRNGFTNVTNMAGGMSELSKGDCKK